MSIRYYRSIMKNEPDVLTVHDTARILRLGKNKVYELIRSGQLPAMKLGKKLIIPKTILIDFMEDGRNYLNCSPDPPKKVWTSEKKCGIVVADESHSKTQKGVNS